METYKKQQAMIIHTITLSVAEVLEVRIEATGYNLGKTDLRKIWK